MNLIDQVLVIAFIFLIGIVIDFLVLRRRIKPWSKVLFWFELFVFLPIPLLLKPEFIVLRFFIAVMCALKVTRAAELTYGHIHDNSMMLDWKRFLIWFGAQGDAEWPTTALEKKT